MSEALVAIVIAVVALIGTAITGFFQWRTTRQTSATQLALAQLRPQLAAEEKKYDERRKRTTEWRKHVDANLAYDAFWEMGPTRDIIKHMNDEERARLPQPGVVRDTVGGAMIPDHRVLLDTINRLEKEWDVI